MKIKYEASYRLLSFHTEDETESDLEIKEYLEEELYDSDSV